MKVLRNNNWRPTNYSSKKIVPAIFSVPGHLSDRAMMNPSTPLQSDYFGEVNELGV